MQRASCGLQHRSLRVQPFVPITMMPLSSSSSSSSTCSMQQRRAAGAACSTSRPQLLPQQQHSRWPAPRCVRTAAVNDTEPDTSSRPTVPDTPPSKGLPPPPVPQQPQQRPRSTGASALVSQDEEFSWREFFSGELPKKLAALIALIAFSRLGVYIRLPGVDVDAFAETMQSSGLLGYVDALSGGSISKVGLFSLGIIPYINASIVLQLFTAVFPGLKKMQREDGAQGRAKFTYYTKLAAFVFAVGAAFGQLNYIRPFVEDFSTGWVVGSMTALVAGAMAMVYLADTITELKLGNGTSVIIFANIASALPASIGALLAQNSSEDPTNIIIFGGAFFLTTLGIIYVQEAERRIPVNYSNRYTGGNLARQSYLPFKVNATGVMPLIFASSLLAVPSALARLLDSSTLDEVARAVGSGGPIYIGVNIALIAFFNYYYTFLQLEPKDLAEQLKKSGAAIPNIRPGRQTAEFVSDVLTRMSLLGSVFLGALSSAPSIVEAVTHLTALRGFAGTSVLIMVGVATDTARRIRAEQAMAKYQDVDKLYDNMKM